MFKSHIKKIVKPAKRATAVISLFERLGIDSLDKLDNLPRQGLRIAGLDTYQLVADLRKEVETPKKEEVVEIISTVEEAK